jgi:hypothetical protein
MMTTRLSIAVYSVCLVASGFVAGAWSANPLQAQTATRVFELRTYTAPEGKLADRASAITRCASSRSTA